MTAHMRLIAVVCAAAAHLAELRVDTAGAATTPTPLQSPRDSEAHVKAESPEPALAPRPSSFRDAMLRVAGAVAEARKEANETHGVLRPKDVMLTSEDPGQDSYHGLKIRQNHLHAMRPTFRPSTGWPGAPPVAKARKALGLIGQGPPQRTAFVIAPQSLFDEKVPILWQLGFDPQRISPVHTTQDCIGGLTSRTGTFLGHREAWKSVAALGKKALILEADWSIGDMSGVNAQRLGAQLHRLADRSDDLTKVGSCGFLCNTAYFLSPWLASLMQHEDPCEHRDGTDVWVKQLCFNETQLQGKSIKCRIVRGGTKYAESQHLYGSGLIFQDRMHIKGLHSVNNTGTYNETHYDTW